MLLYSVEELQNISIKATKRTFKKFPLKIGGLYIGILTSGPFVVAYAGFYYTEVAAKIDSTVSQLQTIRSQRNCCIY